MQSKALEFRGDRYESVMTINKMNSDKQIYNKLKQFTMVYYII